MKGIQKPDKETLARMKLKRQFYKALKKENPEMLKNKAAEKNSAKNGAKSGPQGETNRFKKEIMQSKMKEEEKKQMKAKKAEEERAKKKKLKENKRLRVERGRRLQEGRNSRGQPSMNIMLENLMEKLQKE